MQGLGNFKTLIYGLHLPEKNENDIGSEKMMKEFKDFIALNNLKLE